MSKQTKNLNSLQVLHAALGYMRNIVDVANFKHKIVAKKMNLLQIPNIHK